MTELHPCWGPDHAKEHDGRWCLDCDRAWEGSEWADERAEKRIQALLLAIREAAHLAVETGSGWLVPEETWEELLVEARCQE